MTQTFKTGSRVKIVSVDESIHRFGETSNNLKRKTNDLIGTVITFHAHDTSYRVEIEDKALWYFESDLIQVDEYKEIEDKRAELHAQIIALDKKLEELKCCDLFKPEDLKSGMRFQTGFEVVTLLQTYDRDWVMGGLGGNPHRLFSDKSKSLDDIVLTINTRSWILIKE